MGSIDLPTIDEAALREREELRRALQAASARQRVAVLQHYVLDVMVQVATMPHVTVFVQAAGKLL